ncbi:MAG: hypothetical protein JWN88_213 [Frankiales bacterium]|nr:hypothetical protein [Frankiales bacterium]
MHRRAWSALVSLTALGAGLMFATSAATAHGTDLRASDRRLLLNELLSRDQQDVERKSREADELRAEVAALVAGASAEDSRISRAGASPELELVAGLRPVRGPGVTVTLDDAPRRPGRPALSDDPNDLVVHSEDLQAVVNALRAGGAEAVSLMGQRIVSTTSVRCLGPTVIVNGRRYSPPYVVAAIGDPTSLREALAADPWLDFFRRNYVAVYGVGYQVSTQRSIDMPAYDGPLELPNVQEGRR